MYEGQNRNKVLKERQEPSLGVVRTNPIIEKTGNVAAVQRQLGHKYAAYSLQYARITDEELNVVLDGR